MLTWEIISNLPGLLSLRLFYTKYRKNRRPGPLRIVYSADCLDEVNGIANNLRQVSSYMRSCGHKVALVGNVFNTRTRGVVEDGYVFLLRGFFSMEAIGYANTELSISARRDGLPPAAPLPVDLIEMESPLRDELDDSPVRAHRRHKDDRALPHGRDGLRAYARPGEMDSLRDTSPDTGFLLDGTPQISPLRSV